MGSDETKRTPKRLQISELLMILRLLCSFDV